MTDADAADGSADDWAERLREKRAEKDRFLAEHRQSPVPPEDRDAFDGLEYFAPDEAYQVEATVDLQEPPEPVEMETSDGRTVRYLHVVTFTFDLAGAERTLRGYRQDANDPAEAIFVPFRDKTTGQATYHGGRYMELEPTHELQDGDEVTVDFNLAYTPFCAFSDAFSCPLPPEDNWLETAVEAGEKAP